jgi:transcription termination factor Rho
MAADLRELHLADLHERAAATGVPGYRKLTREELVQALSGPDAEQTAAGPAGPGRVAEEAAGDRAEADTDELDAVVVEGTGLEDAAETAVELGPAGAEGGGERADRAPTEDVHGVLDQTRQGYGFLRLSGLAPSDGDVYISAAQVRRCELRPGDQVAGPARGPRRGERHPALVHVDHVNGAEPQAEARPEFGSLTPVLPERRIGLDRPDADLLVRAVDLLAPLAFGQRVLVRAASRSGRTTLLRALARAAAEDDAARVIVALVDERPEEATAWREALPVAEFAVATADFAAAEQVRVTGLALERARRLAESGVDAVLVCDSLSRLAYAAGDTAEVRRLFGSGRNLAGGGSLTVIATVLADARDEGEAERAVITTESSLIVLDPELAAAGVYPALRAAECRVSNEEQIRPTQELEGARRLRAELADLRPSDAATLLRERLEATPSNAELLASL